MHYGIHSFKDFQDYKSSGPDFAQIWLNLMNLFETGEKLARDSEKNISVKYL